LVVVVVTTIAVSDDVKARLLRVASELQIKLGRRVDLDEALRYLLSERERVKNPQLLEEACRPVADAERVAREAVDELYRERRMDEERLERRYGLRRRRTG
jgi:hypothetical protein